MFHPRGNDSPESRNLETLACIENVFVMICSRFTSSLSFMANNEDIKNLHHLQEQDNGNSQHEK